MRNKRASSLFDLAILALSATGIVLLAWYASHGSQNSCSTAGQLQALAGSLRMITAALR